MNPRPPGFALRNDERIANITTMSDVKWNELQQAEDMAYFRAGLCLYSPESYTLEEKREICNEMISSTKATLDAMRADFATYPPEIKSKLLDMLCQSGIESPEWWWDVLVGEGDPLYRELGRSSEHRRTKSLMRAPLFFFARALASFSVDTSCYKNFSMHDLLMPHIS